MSLIDVISSLPRAKLVSDGLQNAELITKTPAIAETLCCFFGTAFFRHSNPPFSKKKKDVSKFSAFVVSIGQTSHLADFAVQTSKPIISPRAKHIKTQSTV